jgi:ABC-type branched-subunit amino acid transport system ATPase component
LEASGVTVGYAKMPVIFDVDIAGGKGEVVAIVGPNGAGKSTLLKALIGIIAPYSGSIRLGGEDIARRSPDELARRRVGYVPQSQDVFDNLSVEENLRMGGYLLRRQDVKDRLANVVDDLPLLARLLRRPAYKLSGGERKLTAIGRAMMLEPQILIMDEPTAGLAYAIADDLLKSQIGRLADSDRTIILVEQRARAALETANWGYVMVAGRIHRSAPAANLLADDSLAATFFGASATHAPTTAPIEPNPSSPLHSNARQGIDGESGVSKAKSSGWGDRPGVIRRHDASGL